MVTIHFVYAYEASNSNASHVSARCCGVLVLEIPQIARPSEVLVLEGSPYHRVLLVLAKGTWNASPRRVESIQNTGLGAAHQRG